MGTTFYTQLLAALLLIKPKLMVSESSKEWETPQQLNWYTSNHEILFLNLHFDQTKYLLACTFIIKSYICIPTIKIQKGT